MGAGVSRIIGCESWNDLAKRLVKRCFITKKPDGSPCISFKEKEKLLIEKNNKKVITICQYILENNGFENLFIEELKKSLDANPELLKNFNIYEEIYGLRGKFLTTNADVHFDSKFDPKYIAYKEIDFINKNLIKLYHLHGSILDKESLIFTVPKYIARYQDPQFINFLKNIFKNYNILFIGYGMDEFEVLDFLITKYDTNRKVELKHFILLPYYRDEVNILTFDQAYYNTMGVSVIGYAIDENGYNQLYEVIKYWNSEINLVSTYLYNTYQELEDAVQNFNIEKLDKVLLIIEDEPQQNYFFR